MSYISLLRQRIKVIQTIRKTTSAMRLATRAIQSRLRNKKDIFNSYVKAIETIYQQYASLRSTSRQVSHATENSEPIEPSRSLIILVGSHKGLCGAFNERLFSYFKRTVQPGPASLITVGTQATQFLISQGYSIDHHFNNFTSTTLLNIAHELMSFINTHAPVNITIASNKARTFFLQQPHLQEIAVIIPAPDDNIEATLYKLKLQSAIIQTLYDSLLAEQSARFLSMDNATRNAEDVLTQAKIDYNKLRQALVTRELLELANQ